MSDFLAGITLSLVMVVLVVFWFDLDAVGWILTAATMILGSIALKID